MKERGKVELAGRILTGILLGVSAVSYFSFRYFHLFGHIDGFWEAVFCFLQWVKLAGLVMLPAAVFLKTKRFTFAIKWFLLPAAFLSLFFIGVYMGYEKVSVNIQQELYPALVGFMPDALVLVLFVIEAVLMLAASVLTGFFMNGQAERRRSVRSFLLVTLAVVPLSLFDNLVRLLPEGSGFYRFLLFKNFTVWHFLAFIGIFASTYLAYRFLKKKDSATRHRYLCVFAIAVLVQYFSKASRLVGDGYNVYYTIIAFIPLFICNIGVLIAALGIFTRNRVLRDVSFFVHAAGALTVFFYFGKDDMSNFGTAFNYSFLYFTFTHAALYVLCILPVALNEHKFTLKRAWEPIIYYAATIFVAALVSELITFITGSRYGTGFAISPNYAFTQISPIPIPYPDWTVSIFGMNFNLFYLTALFLVYIGLFFLHYAAYCIFKTIIKRFKNRTGKNGGKHTSHKSDSPPSQEVA